MYKIRNVDTMDDTLFHIFYFTLFLIQVVTQLYSTATATVDLK
jgi:hypothetical protein